MICYLPPIFSNNIELNQQISFYSAQFFQPVLKEWPQSQNNQEYFPTNVNISYINNYPSSNLNYLRPIMGNNYNIGMNSVSEQQIFIEKQKMQQIYRFSFSGEFFHNQQAQSEEISPQDSKKSGLIKKKKFMKKKKSQTKNLIKNYGRAMLTFMIKNSKLRFKVLAHLHIKDSQFLESVYMFRNHIHTISAIRYLWQSHPFCQAFRILSCEYLRKHNLQHIFNSRIFKHNIYLKYQDKLMRSLRKPQQFQAIKQI